MDIKLCRVKSSSDFGNLDLIFKPCLFDIFVDGFPTNWQYYIIEMNLRSDLILVTFIFFQ